MKNIELHITVNEGANVESRGVRGGSIKAIPSHTKLESIIPLRRESKFGTKLTFATAGMLEKMSNGLSGESSEGEKNTFRGEIGAKLKAINDALNDGNPATEDMFKTVHDVYKGFYPKDAEKVWRSVYPKKEYKP